MDAFGFVSFGFVSAACIIPIINLRVSLERLPPYIRAHVK